MRDCCHHHIHKLHSFILFSFVIHQNCIFFCFVLFNTEFMNKFWVTSEEEEEKNARNFRAVRGLNLSLMLKSEFKGYLEVLIGNEGDFEVEIIISNKIFKLSARKFIKMNLYYNFAINITNIIFKNSNYR